MMYFSTPTIKMFKVEFIRVLMQRLSFKEYGTKTIVNKVFGFNFNIDEFFLVDVIYE